MQDESSIIFSLFPGKLLILYQLKVYLGESFNELLSQNMKIGTLSYSDLPQTIRFTHQKKQKVPPQVTSNFMFQPQMSIQSQQFCIFCSAGIKWFIIKFQCYSLGPVEIFANADIYIII